MIVHQRSHMFVEVNLKDKRFYKSKYVAKELKNWKYAKSRVLIGRLNNSDEIYRYETCGTHSQRNTTIEHTFEPGEYLILVQLSWGNDVNRYFSVSTYGQSMTELGEIENFGLPPHKTVNKLYKFMFQ